MLKKTKTNILPLLVILGVLIIISLKAASATTEQVMKSSDVPLAAYEPCSLTSVKCENEKSKTITATVTAYNTVPWQTDDSPCIAASGDNICGRSDVIACPRRIPLGTTVLVDEKKYICLDRTAKRYDNRFDISFDKNISGAREFGVRELVVEIIE